MTQALDELIGRIEQATEGSPELDWAIQTVLAPEIVARGLYIKNFTRSVDAALTLVPEGWFIDVLSEIVKGIVYKGDRHDSLGRFKAYLQHRNGGRLVGAEGATLALALSACALRARKAEGERG